jgi:hypothetical protein
MELLATISAAWGWIGLRPEMVVGENDFGNLIIQDMDGRFWRLCPEDLCCRIIADTREELDRLSADQNFLRDWYVTSWVEAAKSKLGPLRPGYKYYLVIPAALGGTYTSDNMQQLPLRELVSLSGDLAQQIEGQPDGTPVSLKVSS